MQPEPPKRQRLHSPILGGGAADDNFDDDSASTPSFQRSRGASASQGGQTGGQKATGGRGLRSPLLGAVDGDDMDEPDPAPRGKGGFGAFGHGPKQKKTEFPHRHHDEDEHGDGQNHAPQASTGGQKNTAPRGGLRSPLLGGGAGDGDYAGGYDDQYDSRSDNRSGGRPSKPGRLRSPILGGSADDYQDEIFDDEVEEINDPTVLRSPLLAVRTPKAHTGANTGVNMGAAQAPAQIPIGGPKAAPFVQGPYTQATPASAPSFSLQTPPGRPAAQNGMSNVPMAPTQPPAYTPPPAPAAPIPAAPAMPAPMQAPAPLPEPQYAYGVNPRSNDMPTAPSGFLSGPVAPASSTNSNMAPVLPAVPAPQAKVSPAAAPDNFDSEDEAPKARGMRGSKLLGGDVSDDPAGPLDRRSRFADRRGNARTDRRTGYSDADADSDHDSSARGGFGNSSAAAPNPMAPIAMALAVVALIAKGYYIMAYISNPAFFTTMLPASIDQICTLLFLVGFILFALKASQKS